MIINTNPLVTQYQAYICSKIPIIFEDHTRKRSYS